MATINRFRTFALKTVSCSLQGLLKGEMIKHPMLVAGCLVATVPLAVWGYRNQTLQADRVEMRSALDLQVNKVAMECVSDSELSFGEARDAEWEEPQVTGNLVVSGEPVQIDLHRTVTRRNRATYTNLVVAECKLIFGTPKHSESSKMAVRRHAVRVMKSHGVRPSHINVMVAKIIELVFIPSKFELEAKRLASSPSAWERISQYSALSLMGASAWLGRRD